MYTVSFYNIDRETFSHRTGEVHPDAEEIGEERLSDLLRGLAAMSPQAGGDAPRLEIRSEIGRFSVSQESGQLMLTELSPNEGAPRKMTPDEALLVLSPGAAPTEGGTPPLTVTARTTKAYRYASAVFIVLGLSLLAYSLFDTFGPQADEQAAPRLQTLVDKTEISQQFAILAGTFSTGLEPGDREVLIGEDGTVKLRLVGENGGVGQEQVLKATPAREGQKLYLVLDNGGIVEPQSRDVLELYGDIYRRVN